VTGASGAIGAATALRLVVRREVVARCRSGAFVLSGLMTLLVLTAAVLVPHLLGGGDVVHRVGVLGGGGGAALDVAESILQQQAGPDRAVAIDVVRLTDDAAARAALSAEDVEAVVVDGDAVLLRRRAGGRGSDLLRALQQAAATVALTSRLAGTGVAVEDVAGALAAQPLEVRTVGGSADPAAERARSAIAYGGMVLLYTAILGYGSWTLVGVAEEKASRVVEVLLAVLRPWQLLAGKVLGIGLLALGQLVLTIAWALVLVRLTDVLELPGIPVDSAVALVLWFVVGFALYSVLYAAAGVLVSRVEDAQSVALPISLVAIVGFALSFPVLDDPDGVLARVATFIPPVSPFVVPIRVAHQAIPAWEHALAVAVAVAAVGAAVGVAGRVYAGGLLQTGGRVRLRQAWRGARQR
jgi:ABC-2 type transport system permease protein